MSDDFFGYNVRLNESPVDIDVDELLGAGKQKLPYIDLSGEGHYTSVAASTVVDYEQKPNYVHQQPTPSTKRKPANLLSNGLWALGAGVMIWTAGNLAIASRSGNMNNVRFHHLNAAQRGLPVLAFLGATGVVAIKRRLMQ